MKVAYIARSIIPSQAANSIHVMKISESFAELCGEMDLVVPEVKEWSIQEDIFEYYGIRTKFAIQRIKKPEWLKGFYRYYFAAAATRKIVKNKYEKVITRDPLVAFMCVLLHKKVVLDLHGELAQICGRAYRIIKWDFFRKSKYLKLVMITDSLVKYYEKKYERNPVEDAIKDISNKWTLHILRDLFLGKTHFNEFQTNRKLFFKYACSKYCIMLTL